MDLNYRNYDKLTDDIEHLGYNLILRLNVTLSKVDKNKQRHFYHKEFMYKSEKYIDTSHLITMRRGFDYYLTLENLIAVDGFKESIMIRNQDIMNIRMTFNKVVEWFNSGLVFGTAENKLIIRGTHDPIYIVGLSFNKQIKIMPTIVKYENIVMPGIRLFMNSDSNFTDINVNKVMAFHYIIHSIDLFGAAQSLVNYNQRPQIGEEIITFEEDDYTDESFMKPKNNTSRKIPSKRNSTSYFDQVDELK